VILRRIILAAFAALAAGAVVLELRSPVLAALSRGEAVELLFLGLDQTEGPRRADLIALVRLDPRFPAVKILQIPRDTWVAQSPSRRINTLYAKGGAAAVERALESLLGLPGGPRPFVVMDFAGFIRFYESLGGVSPAPGVGAGAPEALGVLRSRGPQGDLGRLTAQRAFYETLFEELRAKPWRLVPLLSRLSSLRRSVETDLSAWDAAGLLWRARSWLAPEHLFFFELPGQGAPEGHFKSSPAQAKRLAAFWLGQGTPKDPRPGDAVKLEILNASGEPGLAVRWTKILRVQGRYDVVYYGNAADPEPRARSGLVLREGTLSLAKRVWLSLNNSMDLAPALSVVPRHSPEALLTLILGEDARLASGGLPAQAF
jgi:hypothetical protein